jgi:DNA-binding CsgD family transcriptional regulator
MLHITPAERDALRLLAAGATTQAVADGLGMSAPDVETLVRALMVRMGAGSVADAVAAARRRGLVDVRYVAAS